MKLVRYPELGKEIIIGLFGSGQVFAIPPAIDGKHYPATCVTVEPTKLLILSRQKFLKLMQENAEFAGFTMQIMCGILRDNAETIQNLASSSPEQRVGNVLLRLSDENDPKISLKRQDIADMAGLTTETTIRTIKKLESKGLFSIFKGKIILDQPKLLRDYLG